MLSSPVPRPRSAPRTGPFDREFHPAAGATGRRAGSSRPAHAASWSPAGCSAAWSRARRTGDGPRADLGGESRVGGATAPRASADAGVGREQGLAQGLRVVGGVRRVRCRRAATGPGPAASKATAPGQISPRHAQGRLDDRVGVVRLMPLCRRRIPRAHRSRGPAPVRRAGAGSDLERGQPLGPDVVVGPEVGVADQRLAEHAVAEEVHVLLHAPGGSGPAPGAPSRHLRREEVLGTMTWNRPRRGSAARGRQPLAELEEVDRLVVLFQVLVEQVGVGVLAKELECSRSSRPYGRVLRRRRLAPGSRAGPAPAPPAVRAARSRTGRYVVTHHVADHAPHVPAGERVVADVGRRRRAPGVAAQIARILSWTSAGTQE